jgi:hypothetical protein
MVVVSIPRLPRCLSEKCAEIGKERKKGTVPGRARGVGDLLAEKPMDEGLPVARVAAGVAGGWVYEGAMPIAWCPPSGSDDGKVSHRAAMPCPRLAH